MTLHNILIFMAIIWPASIALTYALIESRRLPGMSLSDRYFRQYFAVQSQIVFIILGPFGTIWALRLEIKS